MEHVTLASGCKVAPSHSSVSELFSQGPLKHCESFSDCLICFECIWPGRVTTACLLSESVHTGLVWTLNFSASRIRTLGLGMKIFSLSSANCPVFRRSTRWVLCLCCVLIPAHLVFDDITRRQVEFKLTRNRENVNLGRATTILH